MDEPCKLQSLKIIIIGAGIGGLICAIACRREGLLVTVLEKASEILPVGAGIQIPPNASRILKYLDLLPQVQQTANTIASLDLRRYEDGKLLASRSNRYNDSWLVIHRADYLKVLLSEAKRLGAEIQLDASVQDVSFSNGIVHLENGKTLAGDVIVGADGLWSVTRSLMLGQESQPSETGDLAYRGTFSLAQLKELNDPRIEELCLQNAVTLWLGPEKHCVFYPVRNGTLFNMVLLRPDDLPPDARTVTGEIEEMRYTFRGWDEVCIPSVLKWKLLHSDELTQWTKGRVILLGDACHPTLPYQAQGAAMAVEDGAVLGKFLGALNAKFQNGSIPYSWRSDSITTVARLYESLRKHRTTQNVKGAINNRAFYHMADGPEQQKRDEELSKHTWTNERSQYMWCDMQYNADLLGVDVLRNAQDAFESWSQDYITILKSARM